MLPFISDLYSHLTDHSEGDVRLSGSGGSAGVVEVFSAGDWYPVCADSAWDAVTVNLLCSTLGHTSGAVHSSQPLLSDSVILSNVSCAPSDKHLSECMPYALDLASRGQCLSNTVLTVTCNATCELL